MPQFGIKDRGTTVAVVGAPSRVHPSRARAGASHPLSVHPLFECLHPLSGDTRTELGVGTLPCRALPGAAVLIPGRGAHSIFATLRLGRGHCGLARGGQRGDHLGRQHLRCLPDHEAHQMAVGVGRPDKAFDRHRTDRTHRLGRFTRLAPSQPKVPCKAPQKLSAVTTTGKAPR